MSVWSLEPLTIFHGERRGGKVQGERAVQILSEMTGLVDLSACFRGVAHRIDGADNH